MNIEDFSSSTYSGEKLAPVEGEDSLSRLEEKMNGEVAAALEPAEQASN